MVGSVLLIALVAPVVEPDLAGEWANASGRGIVRIARCADVGWCGTVEWSSDKAASDAARGGTSTLVGTEILQGFVPSKANHWKGRLFVPDLNKRSSAELRLLEGGRLQVRGCAVGRILCKSQVWKRVERP
jgi:uncharacterized protein (DUF2147 family)